jgi:cystathionine beta-lyase
VARVLHPALPDCPGHAVWKRDFTGSNGLLSIVLQEAPKRAVTAMLDGMKLFGMGYSWGGYESLIIPFDPGRARSATGWSGSGPCLRLHCGLEDAGDLVEDLEAGLERLNAGR